MCLSIHATNAKLKIRQYLILPDLRQNPQISARQCFCINSVCLLEKSFKFGLTNEIREQSRLIKPVIYRVHVVYLLSSFSPKLSNRIVYIHFFDFLETTYIHVHV